MQAQTISKILILAVCAAANAQNPPPPPPPAPQPAQPVRVQPGTPIPGGPQTPAVNVPPDTVVLSVGNEKITRAQFEQWAAMLPDGLKTAINGPQRRKVIEQLSELKALSQAARDRKLDQKPGVQAMVKISTDQALAQALIQELTDDDAMKSYFEQHKSEFEQVKVRHILIGVKGASSSPPKDKKELTDAEALAKAKEIREKIVNGGDFAALAKAESYDPGSATNGGEYTFGHNQTVKEFDAAMWGLPIGQVSEPVKTQFGYHIIRVESRGLKTYDEMKPQIETKLKQELTKKVIDDTKKQVPVTISDDYFGK
jgi:parvulin-like peptidyl-prolyl isomerase